jgi:hypothetical protein
MIGGDPVRRNQILDEWKRIATDMVSQPVGPALVRADQPVHMSADPGGRDVRTWVVLFTGSRH